MFKELIALVRGAREQRRLTRLTRAELEALKLEKFRKLVRHARERSRYYARLVAERGIDVENCVPTDFPPLTKAILMANFDDIVTAPDVTKAGIADFLTRSKRPTELYLDRYRVIHTSGSSGEVGYFVYSIGDWLRGTSVWPRGARPQRKRKGKIRLAYYAAVDGHYAGVTMVSSITNGIARFLLELGLYEVNDPLPTVIERLNAWQPEYLAGYTTALKILAAKQREGVLKVDLIGISVAGEVTTPADRAYLEETFGCPVVNTYGSSEHLGMGSSEPGGSDIVLYDHSLIYEIASDHTLVTNLFNYTLPLIRYRMADILRPVASGKHAPFLVVESLLGRNELQPVFKNRDGVEDFVSPHTINEIFVAGVTQFQLELTGDASFRFMVCLDPRLAPAEHGACVTAVRQRLQEILSRKRMDNVKFDVVVAENLPVNPRTRKFQLIVDSRKPCAPPT
jgi:phenylacetate-coenzyme A ligase PaaK-like adenylate-forming protein